MNTPIPDCPILRYTQRIQALSCDMIRVLRKIKRDLKKCQACDAVEGCPILSTFNAQIQTAISEIADELNLLPIRVVDRTPPTPQVTRHERA